MCFILIIANRMLHFRYGNEHNIQLCIAHQKGRKRTIYIQHLQKNMREKNSTLENLTKLS